MAKNRLTILDREIAGVVADLARRQCDEFNSTLEASKPALSEVEYESLRMVVGKIFRVMFVEVIEPIWERFPELAPVEEREQYESGGPKKSDQ